VQEKFSAFEVASLRNHLLRCGMDTFEAGDMIKMFVAHHGYAISTEMAREVASKLENNVNNIACFHERLETATLVM